MKEGRSINTVIIVNYLSFNHQHTNYTRFNWCTRHIRVGRRLLLYNFIYKFFRTYLNIQMILKDQRSILQGRYSLVAVVNSFNSDFQYKSSMKKSWYSLSMLLTCMPDSQFDQESYRISIRLDKNINSLVIGNCLNFKSLYK